MAVVTGDTDVGAGCCQNDADLRFVKRSQRPVGRGVGRQCPLEKWNRQHDFTWFWWRKSTKREFVTQEKNSVYALKKKFMYLFGCDGS